MQASLYSKVYRVRLPCRLMVCSYCPTRTQTPWPRLIQSLQCLMGICDGVCLCAVWTPPHNSITHFYRPQTKVRKGNVFTRVCQEFCPQGVIPSMHWGRHPPVSTGDVCIPACTGADTPWSDTPWSDTHWSDTPPGQILLFWTYRCKSRLTLSNDVFGLASLSDLRTRIVGDSAGRFTSTAFKVSSLQIVNDWKRKWTENFRHHFNFNF